VHGINAITGSGDPQDDQGHGTHVAGIIGAVGDNSIGMSGVAWRVRLVAGKFLSRTGSGSVVNAVKTINYAVALRKAGYNLVAINASWGASSHSAVLLDAVKTAADAGILIVAAAGNSSSNNDRYPFYPASYSVPNVITVASSDSVGRLSSFSNFGERSVHLVAPGDSIYSTVRGGGYGVKSGTSMAAPYVTGVTVLGWSACNNLRGEQIREHVIRQGLRVPLLNTLVSSGAMVNAMGVVAAARQACAQPTPTPVISPTPGSTALLTATPIPTAPYTATPTAPNSPGMTPSIVVVPRFVAAGERTTVSYSTGDGRASQATLQFVLRDASNRVTRCPDPSRVSLVDGKGSIRVALPGDTKYFGSVEVSLHAPRSVAKVRMSVTKTATLRATPSQASRACAALKSAVGRGMKP
jgi:subtilisin family serine protease